MIDGNLFIDVNVLMGVWIMLPVYFLVDEEGGVLKEKRMSMPAVIFGLYFSEVSM